MRIGFKIVTFISALTFSVLTQPTLAATYAIDAGLPAGGDCEHPFIGGIWVEDWNTCVLPSDPYPGLLIDAGDTLTIESATHVLMPGYVRVRGYMHNKGSIDVVDPEGELWTISWPSSHGTILNDGSIAVHRQSLTNHNRGKIINNGSIDVESGGRFHTVGHASFINHGTTTIHAGGYLSFQGGIVLNEGWIINDDLFGMGGPFRPHLDNRGDFVNNATFETYPGATVNNRGTITNAVSASIENQVPFFNSGTVENDGSIENTGELVSSGTLGNGPAGAVTNLGILTNDGAILNDGLVDNMATLGNYSSIDNAGVIDNPGVIVNVCPGVISGNPVLQNPPIDEVWIETVAGDVFSWCELAGADYQVAMGDILKFPYGSYVQAAHDCVNVSVTFHALPDSPPPGDAIWLLVRTANGTYDTARPSQVGSRDNGIAALCFLP